MSSSSSSTHSCSLKVSFVLCSPPSPSSPPDSSLDVQIKLFETKEGVTYRLQSWLIEYSDPMGSGVGLLKEHANGSAAICYVVGSDRASYERLIEADFNLKYSAPSTPRFLVLLPPSTSASDSITKGKKDAGFFVGEEIERLAWDRGMELVKLDQGIGGENNVIDGVFEHVVEKLGIGEDKLIRDPVFHLGKGVNLGKSLLENPALLSSLFHSPG
ncbi:hypothetical protein TrRE_jg5457 [Triparma retinervis]|uniref:Uncharacterized protein n=1 Tax=Triparma retinervis TaxID=2557542 RepID=A0A9W6ZIR9_9STRA|nr:hypothetical protein TrRE_jg5457 [Triparma retinervis]